MTVRKFGVVSAQSESIFCHHSSATASLEPEEDGDDRTTDKLSAVLVTLDS